MAKTTTIRRRERDREQSAARNIVIAAISPLKAALKDEHITFDDIGVASSPSGAAAYRLALVSRKPVTITVLSDSPMNFLVQQGETADTCPGVARAMAAVTFFLTGGTR